MNDFDLERLAEVWQQPPSQAEVAWMERSALRARRRGRAALWIEAAVAIAVAALVIFLVWISPTTKTAIAGAGAIAVLLLTQRRQRRFRAIELQSLTGSTEDMLDRSIERTRAALKRNWFSLLGIGPATLLGWLLAYYAEGPDARLMVGATMAEFWFRSVGITLLAVVVLYLVLSIRRERAEMERLEIMRASYRREKDDSPEHS